MKLVGNLRGTSQHKTHGYEVSESGDGEGAILPTWTSVDGNNVRTSRELWEYMKREGWNVDVSFFLHLFKILS